MDTIFINFGKKRLEYPIYPLDTEKSLKLRLASDRIIGVPLFPELVKLGRKITAKPIKTIKIKNFTCTEMLNNENINKIIQPREEFILDTFTSDTQALFTEKVFKNKELAKGIIKDIMEKYAISDMDQTGMYIIFFSFGGIANFELSENGEEQLLIDAIFGNILPMYKANEQTYKDILERQLLQVDQVTRDLKTYMRNMLFENNLTTPLRQTRTQITITIEIPDDIYEMFNKMIPTIEIPFIGVGNFYKILNTFKPPDTWPPKDWPIRDDAMILYVSNKKINYNEVKIIPESITPSFGTVLKIFVDDIKEMDIINRILEAVPYDIKKCEYYQSAIDVDYMMPLDHPFYIPLFYDMVMTDKTVSSALVIPETVTTLRERGGIFAYLKYNNTNNDLDAMPRIWINTALTETKDKARDPENIFRDINQPYLSIIISMVDSIIEAEAVRTIINNFLNYFLSPSGEMTVQDKIKQDYLYIFPEKTLDSLIIKSMHIKEVRKKLLKDIAPDMFLPGYQRTTQKYPSILETKEEIEDAQRQGKDIMCFPLDGSRAPLVFVCDRKRNKFVGLKENKLENKNLFPLLPVCEETDHSKNPKTERYKYEQKYRKNKQQLAICGTKIDIGEDELEEEIKENRRIKESSGSLTGQCKDVFTIGQKILDNFVCGNLPKNIYKLFFTIDPEMFPIKTNKMYWIRQGSIKSPNSVLDSIIKAIQSFVHDSPESKISAYKNLITGHGAPSFMSKIFDYNTLSTTRKLELLDNIREYMLQYVVANLTSQSTFDKERQEIKTYLENKEAYLDVSLIWRILEAIFNIEIILFQKTLKYPDGILSAPKYIQEYLQYKSEAKKTFTILLFETIGGEQDKLEYPQVELVMHVQYDEHNNSYAYSWFAETIKTSHDNIILERLHKCFNQLYNYNGHDNFKIPNPFISRPIGQCSDLYGKIRFLQFEHNICILTDPLPPIDITDMQKIDSLTNICSFKPTSKDKALDFIKSEGLTSDQIDPIVTNNMIVGIKCNKNNFTFYIPIEPENFDGSSYDNPIAPTFLRKTSNLARFNLLQRQARYLIQYIIFLFSKWHKANKGDMFDRTYIEKFAQDTFVVSLGHQYPDKIPRLLDMSIPGLFNTTGKFITPSIETRNRLIYGLVNNIRQNTRNVEKYADRSYIKNYYQDITDFDIQKTAILLYGRDAVLSWKFSEIPNYILYDRIRHGSAPYFLRLSLLPDRLNHTIFLVQEAKNIGNALYICNSWITNGINPGKSNQEIDQGTTPYIYIAYNNSMDYDAIIVNGGSNSIVLQYNYNDTIYTTSLLIYKQ